MSEHQTDDITQTPTCEYWDLKEMPLDELAVILATFYHCKKVGLRADILNKHLSLHHPPEFINSPHVKYEFMPQADITPKEIALCMLILRSDRNLMIEEVERHFIKDESDKQNQ